MRTLTVPGNARHVNTLAIGKYKKDKEMEYSIILSKESLLRESLRKKKMAGIAKITAANKMKVIYGTFNADGYGIGTATLISEFSDSERFKTTYAGAFTEYVILSGEGKMYIEELGFTYEGIFVND